MSATQAELKDANIDLSPGITFLGEALDPVAKKLRQVLGHDLKPSGPTFVVMDDLAYHSGVIASGMAHLSERFDNLVNEFLRDPAAGKADAYRTAGRLEDVLSEFVDGYQLTQITQCSPETIHPRALLLGVYRHHISEICDWMEELVNVVKDPKRAMKVRNIPFAESVEVTVELRLTTSPEMVALHALADQMRVNNEDMTEPEAKQGGKADQQISTPSGILETIGALAFGVGITQAVLGRHHGTKN